MVRVDIVGVHRVKKRLASGQLVEYHYVGRGGPRFWKTGDSKPGSTAYVQALQAATPAVKAATVPQFSSLIAKYRQSNEWRKLSDRTKADYSRWLSEIDLEFGDAPIGVFNVPDVRPIALRWRDRWTGRQADYAWQVLRHLVGWAYDRGLLKYHHLRGGGRLYEADRAEIIWPDAARDACAEGAPESELRALDAALETGMRPGDLVQLDSSRVLPTPGGRRISVRTAKRSRLASIPVTPRMAEIIDSAPLEGPILRNASGDPWTTSYLSQRIKKYARLAGLDERLHFYDCRGTACSRLLMAGATLQEIATVFGWSLRHAAAVIESYAAQNPAASDALLRRLAAQSVN